MKLKALDHVTADDRDYQDAIGLGIACGVTTIEELRVLYRKYFGSDDLPVAAQLRLPGLLAAVQADRK